MNTENSHSTGDYQMSTKNLKMYNTPEHLDKPFINTELELQLLSSKRSQNDFNTLLCKVDKNKDSSEGSISDDFAFYIDDQPQK